MNAACTTPPTLDKLLNPNKFIEVNVNDLAPGDTVIFDFSL